MVLASLKREHILVLLHLGNEVLEYFPESLFLSIKSSKYCSFPKNCELYICETPVMCDKVEGPYGPLFDILVLPLTCAKLGT